MTTEASTMAPMAMAMPAQAQDVGVNVKIDICKIKEMSTPQGQTDDGHDGAADVQQEDEADQGNDEHFLGDGSFSRLSMARWIRPERS